MPDLLLGLKFEGSCHHYACTVLAYLMLVGVFLCLTRFKLLISCRQLLQNIDLALGLIFIYVIGDQNTADMAERHCVVYFY